MYKTPELTQMAKVLAEELRARGVEMKHTQAMSTVARMLGARTLQVAQSSPEYATGVRARAIALEQASRLMFESLGRFENAYDIIGAIRAGFALEEEQGSRAVEAAMAELFQRPDSPAVSEAFEPYRLDELPELFETMLRRLTQALLAGTDVQRTDQEILFRGPVQDWRVSEGLKLSELPEHHRTQFEVKMERRGSQFVLDMAPFHNTPDEIAGTDQLSLWVEVNDGRPCVHISNDIYGDMALTIFATKDGLVLRPDGDGGEWIRTYPAPDGTALQTFVDEQYGDDRAFRHLRQQLCFVVQKNYEDNEG